MSDRTVSRRGFLKGVAGTAGLLAFPAIIPSTVFGDDKKAAPSGRVNMGIIGCGGRSGYANSYMGHKNAQIVAVADPVASVRARRKKGKDWAEYSDFRELLARKDVDAVHIATGDYWHVPISLLAARAGKHMYTEKPLGISIEQDLACREIAQKHKRVFQYGTQNRSMQMVRSGIEIALNGHIGEIKDIYIWCPEGASGGSATPELPVPEDFDYEMWLGPAPKAPFCKDRCIQKGARNGIFHIYDYAIGFIAGWGAHPMDQYQWWADSVDLGLPVKVEGTGTIPTKGLFNTLTHWDTTLTYKNGRKVKFMDQRTIYAKKVEPVSSLKKKFGHGTMFVGTDGWICVTRGSWDASSVELLRKGKDPGPKRLVNSGHHAHNFIDAILGKAKTVTDLESSIRSDIICHLCDISIRTGKPVNWDPEKETVVGDETQKKMMCRPMRKPWDVLAG